MLELLQISSNWKKPKVVVLPGSVPDSGVLETWGEHAAVNAEGQRNSEVTEYQLQVTVSHSILKIV